MMDERSESGTQWSDEWEHMTGEMTNLRALLLDLKKHVEALEQRLDHIEDRSTRAINIAQGRPAWEDTPDE
jgi:hypothetical protein